MKEIKNNSITLWWTILLFEEKYMNILKIDIIDGWNVNKNRVIPNRLIIEIMNDEKFFKNFVEEIKKRT